ncbi:MAG: NAD(P)H-dependent oxidoreductase [Chloroflexi bacterium]|nr:NAD(P)H-dependent oxidoreductase [Ardenticatenaceae bacterium]MBL1127270.1 NADPH-dependent oxidoreductase [Chloroflexota bacterium]NOG33331.1 NAD(P)H-dependent oxidoreductase [Chloroflexota bacterium]GIK56155.1 MAG: NAD(P)H-dependent FMN reductase [Chloroflexota bacterium]
MADQTEHLHILGISGSLRQDSYNTALLRAAEELLPPDMSLEIADLRGIPFFDADLETEGTPDKVRLFRERIRQADALLFATPEYNYSITGVLKNAIDWASRNVPDRSPLDGKTAALMGAGGRYGTLRAQLHLREILQHNEIAVLPHPQLMIPFARQQFDADGRLTDDDMRQRLQRLLLALQEWARRLQK